MYFVALCALESLFTLAGQQLAEQATANVSCLESLFLVNSMYTNNVLNACVHV